MGLQLGHKATRIPSYRIRTKVINGQAYREIVSVAELEAIEDIERLLND